MKKLLPPVMAALLLASCGNNTLGTSEGAVSQEVTVTLGADRHRRKRGSQSQSQ